MLSARAGAIVVLSLFTWAQVTAQEPSIYKLPKSEKRISKTIAKPSNESNQGQDVVPAGFTLKLDHSQKKTERIGAVSDSFSDQSGEFSNTSVRSAQSNSRRQARYTASNVGEVESDDSPAPAYYTLQPKTEEDDENGDDRTPSSKKDKKEKCKRIYNDRDCCEAEDRCAEQRQRLRENSLSKFTMASLDISPPYRPEAATEKQIADAEAAKKKKFAQAGSRSWRDRSGRIVAEGLLKDLKLGRVVIEDQNGQSVQVPLDDLTDDDRCFVQAWWEIPAECTLGDDTFAGRQWTQSTFAWKASGLCHKPLYFEEDRLERYGHTHGPWLQPVISGGTFATNLILLPYHVGMNPPQECQYALGYYRPGSCAPKMVPRFPLSVRGALVEAGVIGLGVWWIP